MRCKDDTEMIITDYITPGGNNEYMLVCIQSCKEEEEVTEEGEGEGQMAENCIPTTSSWSDWFFIDTKSEESTLNLSKNT